MVELKLAVWLIAICTFRHQGLQSFLCDFDDSFLIRRFAEFETSTIRPSSDHQIIHQFHQYLQIPRPWAMRNPLRSLQFQNVEGQAMNCTSNRHRHDVMGRRFFMETTQELRIQQSKMASGWWFQPTPLKKYEFVSCDYEIPAIYGKSFKSHVPVTTNKWLVWPLTNSLHTKRSPLSLFEVLLAVAIWWFLQYQPLTPGRTATFLCKKGIWLCKKKNTNGFSPFDHGIPLVFCRHPGTTPVKLGVGVQGSNDGGEKNLAVLAGQLGELRGWSLSPQFGRHKSSGVGGSALSLWWSKSDSIEE